MSKKQSATAIISLLMLFVCVNAATKADTYTNSLGMEMVSIEPGSFMMGQERQSGRQNITQTYGNRQFLGGEVDEQPVHKVNITKPFYMASAEVTNHQYEQFDPKHRSFRGRNDLSKDDDEAVVFVSWNDAVAFCEWLSKKEGKTYRLPTEAEWEYACRAGTTTIFNTGDTLPDIYQKEQKHQSRPSAVSTRVAVTLPNAWGIHDMHGNVEEWCYDWYGPYEAAEQTDPVGCESGIWKVTRGGSHNVYVKSLRSANRLNTLAEDKNWLIGIRVVQAELPKTKPLPAIEPPLNSKNVSQEKYDWSKGPDANKPYFKGPIKYVIKPENPEAVPFFFHNHVPGITWCDNGDLLAAWFSCARERGRDLGIAASRFRRETGKWDEASTFFNARDRNMHGTGLFNTGDGRLLHLNGLGTDGWWSKLALTLRVSTDNGATWSYPKLADPEHGGYIAHMVMSRTKQGHIIFPCDAPGGTGFYISKDNGNSWAIGTRDGSGKNIMGSHAAAVELADGSIFSLGRGKQIDGQMPVSLSKDLGETWEYYASEFPPVSGGQKAVLLRLNEGPILFVGFTDRASYQKVIVDKARPRKMSKNGITITDADGKQRQIYGMFASVSFDEGKTWPIKKLVTAGGAGKILNGEAWTQDFIMDETHAEPLGYLTITQTPDNVVHLASSGQHYRFNLAWLKEPMPPATGDKRTLFMGENYPAKNQYADQPGVLGMEFVYGEVPFKQCHASTIAAAEDGLVAAWFGGTREKNPDVGIWLSRNTAKGWTDPVEVANGIESPEKRYPCWNPVLFQPRPGPLMLFYKIGPDPRTWWGMMMTSQDSGKTWSKPKRLPDGFFGPIKNKPFLMPGGDILCPSSTEDNGWRVHLERYSPRDGKWQMIGPINDGKEFGAIQPSILTYLEDDPTRDKMQILCRSQQNVITQSWSKDAGKTWSKMTATSLPNPNAGTDAITMTNGMQLLVYNHTTRDKNVYPKGRGMLNVAVSKDGIEWKPALILEKEDAEFSYPAVIQTPDDLIHITYTWKRSKVKHVVIEPEKLVLKEFVDGKWPF